MTKRIFDLTVALIGLIFIAPILFVIAFLIKLDSPGSIFFKGARVGQYGRLFHIFKFRSMVPDAPQKGPSITCGDDPRITRIGRFLRRTKLDELPGLFNVLKGEMSLVGPRPEAPCWVERYTPYQRQVLMVKPGITGLAQVTRGYDSSLESVVEKVKHDVKYIRTWSIFSDIKILAKTVLVVLTGKGAF